MGEISSDGTVSRGAISYSLGSNGGYVLKDDKVSILLNNLISKKKQFLHS